MFLIIEQYFFNNITIDFFASSDLKSNTNSLLENLIIRVFLVYCLICLNFSLIVLKSLICEDQF